MKIVDIFIFDDHAMLRKGLIACFSDSSVYRIAGEADNIENAKKKVISAYSQCTTGSSDTPAKVPAFPFSAVAIVDVGFSFTLRTRSG